MDDNRWTAMPVAVAFLGVLMLPVLYFLSTGPAVLLLEGGYISEPLMNIYLPLEYAAEHSPWFDTVLQTYVGLYVPD